MPPWRKTQTRVFRSVPEAGRPEATALFAIFRLRRVDMMAEEPRAAQADSPRNLRRERDWKGVIRMASSGDMMAR